MRNKNVNVHNELKYCLWEFKNFNFAIVWHRLFEILSLKTKKTIKKTPEMYRQAINTYDYKNNGVDRFMFSQGKMKY